MGIAVVDVGVVLVVAVALAAVCGGGGGGCAMRNTNHTKKMSGKANQPFTISAISGHQWSKLLSD